MTTFMNRKGDVLRASLQEVFNVDPGLMGLVIDVTETVKKRRKPIRDELSYSSTVRSRLLRRRKHPRRRASVKHFKNPFESSESSGGIASEMYNIEDILFEVYDSKKSKLMALATFVGFDITDAAWISVDEMTMDARVWWEQEKRKRFPMLVMNDMLKYVDGRCLLWD